MLSRLSTMQRRRKAEHAKLYSEALNNLPKLKGSKAKDYFVCTVCGYTTSQMDFSKCPSCFTSQRQVRESQLATGPSKGRPASSD